MLVNAIYTKKKKQRKKDIIRRGLESVFSLIEIS